MFEPVLDHNRAEFSRLRDRQRVAVVAFPLLGGASVVVTSVFNPREWFYWLLAGALLAMMFGTLAVLEVRKTMIFRNDLREQQQGPFSARQS